MQNGARVFTGRFAVLSLKTRKSRTWMLGDSAREHPAMILLILEYAQ